MLAPPLAAARPGSARVVYMFMAADIDGQVDFMSFMARCSFLMQAFRHAITRYYYMLLSPAQPLIRLRSNGLPARAFLSFRNTDARFDSIDEAAIVRSFITIVRATSRSRVRASSHAWQWGAARPIDGRPYYHSASFISGDAEACLMPRAVLPSLAVCRKARPTLASSAIAPRHHAVADAFPSLHIQHLCKYCHRPVFSFGACRRRLVQLAWPPCSLFAQVVSTTPSFHLPRP